MARLSIVQIKKLSPAQKKKRAKLLQYLAARRAAKRDGKQLKRPASPKPKKAFVKNVTSKRSLVVRPEKQQSDAQLEKLERLTNELKAVREREKELLALIRSI